MTELASTEAVESATLALECEHHIHYGDRFAASVLGVSDRVANDVFQENLQHSAGLLVDKTRDAFDTTTSGETSDRWLGDALHTAAERLAMAFGPAFTQSFAAFASSAHDDRLGERNVEFNLRWE